MMEIDPVDKCELCGNSRAFHKNKRAGFHAFVPSAQEIDALDDRGRALSQGPLASTLSAKPSDLLAELKAERGKHEKWPHGLCSDECRLCGVLWPCPLSRALDCAIALLMGTQEFKRQADCCGDNYNYGDLASEAADTLAAAARAYHGGRDGEEE